MIHDRLCMNVSPRDLDHEFILEEPRLDFFLTFLREEVGTIAVGSLGERRVPRSGEFKAHLYVNVASEFRR